MLYISLRPNIIEYQGFVKSLLFCERSAHSLFCAEQPEQIANICWYDMSNLSDLLTVAHLSWASWGIRSQSLICPERFAHSLSLVLSNLSESLSFAHLSWATWANCSHLLICPEQFERIPSPVEYWRKNFEGINKYKFV